MIGAQRDQAEALGSNSIKHVEAPWDVKQAYLCRTARAVMLLPEASRLQWVEERDIAERAAWVSQFREGKESLGQVVQSVMQKRGAHWDTPIQNVIHHMPSTTHTSQPWDPKTQQSLTEQNQGQQRGAIKRTRQGEHKPQLPPTPLSSSPSKMKPGTMAVSLRDGMSLCPEFNKGSCHIDGPSCYKGAHRCSKVRKNGRPCGMSGHGAHSCRNS